MGEYLEEPVLVELHVAAGGGHLGMKTVGSRLLGPSNEGVSLEMLLICQHFQKVCISQSQPILTVSGGVLEICTEGGAQFL